MKVTPTALAGVLMVEPKVFGDERGWFMESHKDPVWRAAFEELGLAQPRPFLQDNHSCSQAGVLRGLHYQLAPRPQGKLVRVVQGRAFDVAVDIRQGSPQFGRWVGVELTAENHRQLWIPEGFAHGFLALEDDTHFLYKTTDVYAKDCERCIRWDDPAIGIQWPSVSSAPRLAPKDASAPALAAAEFPSYV
jgi:dTDP-4-dehydrorhamnose 3,5-epimerase